jgi:hypothetical protein
MSRPFTLIDDTGADFSEDRNYRYSLWRIWDRGKPLVMFIGLNPSKAGELNDDPTIRRVKAIAKNLGYGGVYMMNCFAYISTDPKLLKINPMSKEWNDNMLTIIASRCQDGIFAWGNFDIVKSTGRDLELIEMFPNAKALHINKNGSPKHPLYVRGDVIPVKFNSH